MKMDDWIAWYRAAYFIIFSRFVVNNGSTPAERQNKSMTWSQREVELLIK